MKELKLKEMEKVTGGCMPMNETVENPEKKDPKIVPLQFPE